MINPNPTHYDDGTPEPVKAVIDSLLTLRDHSDRRRIRIYYGDAQTGKDWTEEYSTQGYIGRSTGSQPIPLLVHNARSYGGVAILTACIVKITCKGRTLYQHPAYHLPEFTAKPSETPGYLEDVYADGEHTASFKNPGQAGRYIAYLRGERDAK